MAALAPPTPEQVCTRLQALAAQLPPAAASEALALADGIQRADWYDWDRIQRSKEARAIDLQEAGGIISPELATQLRIALAMRGCRD